MPSLHTVQVTREPVRTRAVDQVVQKTVLQTSEEEKATENAAGCYPLVMSK